MLHLRLPAFRGPRRPRKDPCCDCPARGKPQFSQKSLWRSAASGDAHYQLPPPVEQWNPCTAPGAGLSALETLTKLRNAVRKELGDKIYELMVQLSISSEHPCTNLLKAAKPGASNSLGKYLDSGYNALPASLTYVCSVSDKQPHFLYVP